MLTYNYAYPSHIIPKFFLMKRHNYVRSLLKNGSILDLGCSHYKIVARAIGLDSNPKVRPNMLGSCLEIPFSQSSFDVVTALEVIEHFTEQDQHRFLEEIYRVLRPYGQFIISTPNLFPTKKIHDTLFYISHSLYAKEDVHAHKRELTHDELKNLLIQHHFRIQSEKAFSFFNYVVDCEKI